MEYRDMTLFKIVFGLYYLEHPPKSNICIH